MSTHASPVTAEQVTDAVLAGSWVVDLRCRADFAEGHVPGSVNIEYPAGPGRLSTYVGWLVPCSDDIVLLTDSPTVLGSALRDLATLGLDGVATHLMEPDRPLTASYRRAGWAEFREACLTRDPVVVDVRPRDDWESAHLPGSLHLAVEDAERDAHALPTGQLWVHCRSGYRAGIAASLLHRAGRDVVHVDDAWERRGDVAVVAAAA